MVMDMNTQVKQETQKPKMLEEQCFENEGGIMTFDHLIIRDKETKQQVLNKRG